MPCKGSGHSELRIRFVETGPKKSKRRKSAPVRATSVFRSAGRLRRPDPSPTDFVSPGFDERQIENGGFRSPMNLNDPKDAPNTAFTAFHEQLDDSSSTAAGLPLNDTPLDHNLDTLAEVVLPVNHEGISTPSMTPSGILSNHSSEITVHCSMHEPANVGLKPRCLWPLAEKEVQLVKHFFTVLVSWVNNQILMPKFSIKLCF